MLDLPAADTRVFLFHSPNASTDPGGAMDAVNQWLAKDRSGGAYAKLRVKDISVADDGKGGIYVTVVCSLGRITAAAESATASASAAI